jgi:hypothetical protein
MTTDSTHPNNQIAARIARINTQIAQAAKANNRDPKLIKLLAVSKTKPVSDIVSAYKTGHRDFGENYVQEALEKIQQMTEYSDVLWHFIGPLQSNKSKFIAEHFDWMHSLDRIKIAQRLNEQRSVHQKPLNVCVQINIDDEQSKAGISPNDALDFIQQLQKFDRLTCRGLMTIPKADVSISERKHSFAKMQRLYNQCAQKFSSIDTLSMGMSDDIEIAIEYGSTLVRVGTAIFGKRE